MHSSLFLFFFLVGEHMQTVTSTPKTSYKPLASVTPFVPLSKQQQQHVMQHQRQEEKDTPIQPQASYNRDKYQVEGINNLVVESKSHATR